MRVADYMRRRGMGAGWNGKTTRGSGVLLDKYREEQRHGGSNENENKGALSGSMCSGATREKRDTLSDYTLNFPSGKKADCNKTNDVAERSEQRELRFFTLYFALAKYVSQCVNKKNTNNKRREKFYNLAREESCFFFRTLFSYFHFVTCQPRRT